MNTEPLLATALAASINHSVSNMWTRKKPRKIMDDMGHTMEKYMSPTTNHGFSSSKTNQGNVMMS